MVGGDVVVMVFHLHEKGLLTGRTEKTVFDFNQLPSVVAWWVKWVWWVCAQSPYTLFLFIAFLITTTYIYYVFRIFPLGKENRVTRPTRTTVDSSNVPQFHPAVTVFARDCFSVANSVYEFPQSISDGSCGNFRAPFRDCRAKRRERIVACVLARILLQASNDVGGGDPLGSDVDFLQPVNKHPQQIMAAVGLPDDNAGIARIGKPQPADSRAHQARPRFERSERGQCLPRLPGCRKAAQDRHGGDRQFVPMLAHPREQNIAEEVAPVLWVFTVAVQAA